MFFYQFQPAPDYLAEDEFGPIPAPESWSQQCVVPESVVLLANRHCIQLCPREAAQTEGEDCHLFAESAQIYDLAFRLANVAEREIPRINGYPLLQLIYSAIENAAFHGAVQDSAEIEFTVSRERSGLIATITNHLFSPFPAILNNRIITAHDSTLIVPHEQRDSSRGREGQGVLKISLALPLLFQRDASLPHPPSVHWQVEEALGIRKANFSLRLPQAKLSV